jgi:hypothetical protein
VGHEPTGDQPVKKPTSKTATIVGGIIAAAIIGGICAMSVAHSRQPEDRSTPAVNACEGFVKDQLKAPSTARFSNERYGQDGLVFTVTGDVDAQNSFGATIRNHYTCVVTDTGADFILRSPIDLT